MLNTDCGFCQILEGELPATFVDEWEEGVAFTPLNPVVEGHTLVIPKPHITHAGNDPYLAGLTMQYAAEFAQQFDSFNIITSAGKPATQSIDHLHIHVVPRTEDDQLMTPWGTIFGDEPSAPHWCRVAKELNSMLPPSERVEPGTL